MKMNVKYREFVMNMNLDLLEFGSYELYWAMNFHDYESLNEKLAIHIINRVHVKNSWFI